ncbi:hypothetical protein ONZ51_g12083 [Trametes cubensis]|uniref:Uncharacterized protein n=1 Tax=Trametes cubensis TaxID=1111947 RepID=A0AAD7TGC4_9APHY|nr:hypothetical protein ONZ51_g12083 [Trametes cubensis]
MDTPDVDDQYDASAIVDMRGLMTSSIVSFAIETLFCGAFTITYAANTWALLRIGRRGKPPMRDWGIFVASTAMFCLALTHLTLSLELILLGFVQHAGSISSVFSILDSTSDFDDGDPLSAAIFTAKVAIYVTQTLIGDAFMIYRLYVIWGGRKKILIFPALLFLGSLALVMWRILRSGRDATAPPAFLKRMSMTRKAAEAIVQSAAIYSIASIALVITYLLSPNMGWSACLNVFPPLIGLVFSFIVKRITRHSISNPAETILPHAYPDANKRPNVSMSSIASPSRRPHSLELMSLPIVDNSNETLPNSMEVTTQGTASTSSS